MGLGKWFEIKVDKAQRVSNGVEILIDVLRNGVNLGVQLIFNSEQIGLVILSDEVNGQS